MNSRIKSSKLLPIPHSLMRSDERVGDNETRLVMNRAYMLTGGL
jgi:hypothetical protein